MGYLIKKNNNIDSTEGEIAWKVFSLTEKITPCWNIN